MRHNCISERSTDSMDYHCPSDCNTRFLSHFWRCLWQLSHTRLDFSSAYHPQMDGLTEVVNWSLGALLQSLVGENLKSWDRQLYQAEFAYNQSINRSTGLRPFTIIYGNTDKKRHALEFEEGDFVWAVLTKDRFPVAEYNKLAARKIGLLEIVKKINPNAYQLKLPRHIKTSDVFNIKHLVPFIRDSSDEDVNSRANSVQSGEDDVDHNDWEYMRKTQTDGSVKTPQKMVTRSQTRVAANEVSGTAIDRTLTAIERACPGSVREVPRTTINPLL
ncbi:uncharacterized protein LOC132178025 [Corylus avellana]|uniref:uncharacterized protein LOC132178025 n=1 Tax=Corylus avellana TaxID=13451 RepID=UPI00286AF65E|nr:uncharacterized protein LOC132178025 [Corylus avellana]